MVCDGAHTSQHIPSMYVRRNLRSLVFRVEKKGFPGSDATENLDSGPEIDLVLELRE